MKVGKQIGNARVGLDRAREYRRGHDRRIDQTGLHQHANRYRINVNHQPPLTLQFGQHALVGVAVVKATHHAHSQFGTAQQLRNRMDVADDLLIRNQLGTDMNERHEIATLVTLR